MYSNRSIISHWYNYRYYFYGYSGILILHYIIILLDLFNKTIVDGKILVDWRKSLTVPVFKGKGTDIDNN